MHFLRAKDIVALPGSFPLSLPVAAGASHRWTLRETLPFLGGGGSRPKVLQRVCRALDRDSGAGWVSAWRLAFRSALGKSRSLHGLFDHPTGGRSPSALQEGQAQPRAQLPQLHVPAGPYSHL